METTQGHPAPGVRRFQWSLRSLFFLFTVATFLMAVWRYRESDIAALQSRRAAFQAAFQEHRWHDAYGFMSPDYREHHTLTDFVKEQPFGVLPDVSVRPEVGLNLLGRTATVYSDEPEYFLYNGAEFYWRKQNGIWYFTDEYAQFLD